MRITKDAVNLSLVIPVFNESLVLPETYNRLKDVFDVQEKLQCEFIFVDDGSKDGTSKIVRQWIDNDSRVRLIRLSRNFGHQAALAAGLSFASGDVVAIIDGDLQDPPEVILEMLKLWQAGNDVVFGVRQKRKESVLKRLAYSGFYRVWRKLASIEMPLDSGDFCIIDRKVVDEINQLPEISRFFRGLRSWVGYNQIGFPYERAGRAGGDSKYSFFALMNLALTGITDFSTTPLKVISLTGLVTSFVAVFGILLIIAQRIFNFSLFGMAPSDVPGWTSVALILLLVGGVQLFGLGILGMYVGRIYEETKRRPTFVIESTYGF